MVRVRLRVGDQVRVYWNDETFDGKLVEQERETLYVRTSSGAILNVKRTNSLLQRVEKLSA